MERSRLLGAVSACLFALVTTLSNAALLPLEGRLETAPGSGVFLAYYDPNLDNTWATDANINGLGNWNNQVAWAAGLTLGGVSGWRLPSADVNGDSIVVNCGGSGVPGAGLPPGCADNEMGFLYYGESIMAAAPGPFTGVQFGRYWYGTEFDSVNAYRFIFFGGTQSVEGKNLVGSAWAVHSGDVPAVVPVPAAVWLFGSGLLGLIVISRRKKGA